MASDDRDRTFEKALARHLRSSAASGADANALAGASAALCPDPETLAAYHDGSLSPDERNLWKQHVLTCENCQLVLAHLATPLEIPVNLDGRESVLGEQKRAAAAQAPSAASIARPSPLHSLRWLWLVPAGAIAATLIVWISLQEPKHSPLSPPSAVEVAENREAPAGASSPNPAHVAPSQPKRKDQAAGQTAGGAAGAAPVKRDAVSKESQVESQLAQRVPSQNAATPAHGPSVSQQKQEQQIGRIASSGANFADQKKLDTSSPKPTGQGAGTLAKKTPTPSPPPPPPASSEPSFVADGTVPPPPADKTAPTAPAPASPATPSTADASSGDSVTNASTAPSSTVEVSAAPQSLAKTRAVMRAAALQNPHVFAAPGGKLWRIGPAGSLEHSKDKGLTWTPQISGVYTDLLAGSAPSEKVCWVVGGAGTVLLTTDGGAHWAQLGSPVSNDLTGVRAADATHASVWFVPDQQTGLLKTYQTSDGGHTWTSVPGE